MGLYHPILQGAIASHIRLPTRITSIDLSWGGNTILDVGVQEACPHIPFIRREFHLISAGQLPAALRRKMQG
ncbi:MAG: hypothetical protein K6T90_14550 [Leptolyngbyaceae cyanobacterium HOT.MB2.61]|nr:hypothetical protein [Leptolyngbyaceae cyanobacterium HOT.MB2.61]